MKITKAAALYIATVGIAVVSALAVTSVHAQTYMNGNSLLQRLSSSDTSDRRSGLTYVMGVLDAQSYAGGKRGYCAPDSVTAGQVADVVRDYIQANPKHRHRDGAILTTAAMIDAFPCEQQTQGRTL